ncbi:Methyltransferase domain-containing protein [Shimia gijangensis]|uniref:Methyltransferase domain-containing protein n=1 Tax=Shimia gijangensis TaxID=1470563 RepID=A0A1M6BI41_9RHOB|nr:class I SAM-dependent methyltransferase [Shimia gijangensis]SHI48379.1 Methyltransferase domain-containing protein [Shimia gijangensis]
MSDAQTMNVYDTSAETYLQKIARSPDPDEQSDFEAFVAALTNESRVLDLGCGPGHWAAKMKQAGLSVDACDASAEMAALAKGQFGVDVRVEPFNQLTLNGPYDGIWANFSLLHAPRAEFPIYLSQLHEATKPNGILHLGMKLGAGEVRDSLGRLYSYYSEIELTDVVETSGYTVTHTRRGEGAGLSGQSAPYLIVTAHA